MSFAPSQRSVGRVHLLAGSCALLRRDLCSGLYSGILFSAASTGVDWNSVVSSSWTKVDASDESVDAYRRHCAVQALFNGRSASRSRRKSDAVTSCSAMVMRVFVWPCPDTALPMSLGGERRKQQSQASINLHVRQQPHIHQLTKNASPLIQQPASSASLLNSAPAQAL